jgi:hypothetical protein
MIRVLIGETVVAGARRASACQWVGLSARHAVYVNARARHPERWSGDSRNWAPMTDVRLNPDETVESPTWHLAA